MDDIKERLIATEERAKSNTKRIDEHDKEINKLKKTYSIMEKMDYRMQNVENNVSKINTKLDKQEEKILQKNAQKYKEKGMKWDKLIDAVSGYILRNGEELYITTKKLNEKLINRDIDFENEECIKVNENYFNNIIL